MDEKNVPTALIEIVDANGSLGDWVVSDWTSTTRWWKVCGRGYAEQLGRRWRKKSPTS